MPKRSKDQCLTDGCEGLVTTFARVPENEGLCMRCRKARQLREYRARLRDEREAECTTPDKLGRLLDVVKRLGGLERAEQLAAELEEL